MNCWFTAIAIQYYTGPQTTGIESVGFELDRSKPTLQILPDGKTGEVDCLDTPSPYYATIYVARAKLRASDGSSFFTRSGT